MPPPLALFLTLGFIAYLFRRDFRERPNVTSALWLPVLWLFLSCSRPTSMWLAMFGVPTGFSGPSAVVESMEEGSPIDRLVYIALIACGFYVLSKRQVNFSRVIEDNAWLAAFFLFCFLAIWWSDYPLTSLKRWIKILGHPIMVLIIFSEPDPAEALLRVIKRCAYVVLPVSILFIKYYPKYGRTFEIYSGEGSNTGIATNKNTLGCACLILGIFLFWHFLQVRQQPKGRARKQEMLLTGFLLFMVGYLLRKAHSATSTIALVAGIFIILALGLRLVNKRAIAGYAILGLVLLGIAQLMFDVFGAVVELSGHGSTIEGRGLLWQELLRVPINPLFGTGFESFWLGKRLTDLWALHWWHPTEAHNGYLETYINLGAVGLAMLILLLIATFVRIKNDIVYQFEWGRFRLGVLIAVILYNWTEAAFKGLSPLWFVFYIIAIEYIVPSATVQAHDESTPQRQAVFGRDRIAGIHPLA